MNIFGDKFALIPLHLIIDLIREAFSAKTSRALAISAGIAYAVFYLFATGTISYYPDVDLSQYVTIPYFDVSLNPGIGWSPWIVSYPTNNVVVSIPFWVLMSTLLLGVLLASYIALLSHMVLRQINCKSRNFVGVVGIIPASFSVVGCCSPTLLFVIGLASLTGVLWQLTALLTVGSFVLLLIGIYSTGRNMIRCLSDLDNRSTLNNNASLHQT